MSQTTLIAALQRFLPHSEATVATPGSGRESTDTLTGGENFRLPAALYERLQTLRPPFTSINELEAFGRSLALEGERRENSALRDLGQLLLRQAEAFDGVGLRQRIEALKAAAQPGG